MRVPMARLGRVRGLGRWLGVQIAVAVVAAVGVSAMFAGGSPPAPLPIVADTGKSARRVAHQAETDATVLQFDAQQQAARASIASFTPMSSPAVVTVPPAARAAKDKTITVLPPRRPSPSAVVASGSEPAGPALTTEAVPATEPSPQNWRVVGVDIPGSGKVRRFIPSGADLLKPADVAWTASKNAVRKVASFGELFGL